MTGNFSAYPWDRVPKLTARQAQLESMVARWLAATPRGDRLAKLVGSAGRAVGAARPAVRVELVAPRDTFDPFAARCEVRVGAASFDVRGASFAVRMIAQRLLGGPE